VKRLPLVITVVALRDPPDGGLSVKLHCADVGLGLGLLGVRNAAAF
jgi:hypothetical protein